MASVDLAQLLEVCVRATLAAQRYVMLDLIQLPAAEAAMSFHNTDGARSAALPQTVLDLSEADRAMLLTSLRSAVNVDVKSHLDYKEGSAAEDLVTTADVLTQAVLTHALNAAFPGQPFTVVGEEEEPSAAIAAEADTCIQKHYGSHATMPYHAALQSHLQVCAPSSAASVSVVHADSAEALRRRVGIFIDPIDGTNCFFDGVWQAPMTLVGITLDGVPVAGIMNRVFYYPLTHSTSPGAAAAEHRAPGATRESHGCRDCVPSLSFIFNAPGLSSPFVVFDGALLPSPVTVGPHPPCTPTAALMVCRSSTTKEEFLHQILQQLQPCTSICARGAGYKQYHLLKQMWAGAAAPCESITPADIFVCPPVTIKKWDCCAPHAFLLAMGGDIFSHVGTPLRYPLVLPDGSAGTHTELAALPKGLLALTPYVKDEVARRMQWAAGASCGKPDLSGCKC